MPFGGYNKCQAGMCASGMLAGGDQTVITLSFNAWCVFFVMFLVYLWQSACKFHGDLESGRNEVLISLCLHFHMQYFCP